MPTRLKTDIFVILRTDLAQLECGSHLTVELILLLGHLYVILDGLSFGSEQTDVRIYHPTVGIKVTASHHVRYN